ncbi:MAG: alpha-amylase [Spirochaetes bacterium]|nr:alpha-amylase [Spirochaetota bacterium]
MSNWINESVFYHFYVMGFCGAPERNDFHSEPVERLMKTVEWIPHLKNIGVNAVVFSPIFESMSHGYDTVDYFRVDRRLGTNDTLKRVVQEFHANGIRVVLDGVFNHSSREFFAFKDIKTYRENSNYKNWYKNLRFNCDNCYRDGFSYEGWAGHFELVKFNLDNHDTREHIFEAVRMWIKEFDIDGLRLDAADVIDFRFLSDLSKVSKSIKPDFWLKGEVVHGDYKRWINEAGLDSVTNYEAYKGLWSSFNDKNFFEINYSLNRQFGDNGLCKGKTLYNFLDNHDVDRITETLKNHRNLAALYGLLFTMPGVPSVYYGSEFGIKGKRSANSDKELRPNLSLDMFNNENDRRFLSSIKKLADIRKNHKALKYGDYKTLLVSTETLAFSRNFEGETIVVCLNCSDGEKTLNLPINLNAARELTINEEIRGGEVYIAANGIKIIKAG